MKKRYRILIVLICFIIILMINGSHSLPMEYPQELNLELLEFMRKTDNY